MTTTISPELAAQALRIPWTRYIPHAPHAHQHAFLWLSCEEALYGGAAGGGKSDALLMAALQYVDQPGYAALLLRRTYKDLSLPGALMSRAEQWLAPTDAKWNGETKTWTFPSGATLTFGYLQTSKDKFQYQGAEFNFVGFDEATQFAEDDYTYLFSRLRRLEGSVIPGRMRCASNPGGEGHEWVKRRFVTGASREGRIFIPAQLADNPSLDQAAYLRSLLNLDAVTREQLLNGDWDIRPATGREFFPVSRVDKIVTVAPRYQGSIIGAPIRGGRVRFVEQGGGDIVVWQLPKPGLAYTIGADVAGTAEESVYNSRAIGKQSDAYCAYVAENRTGRVVARLYGRDWTETEFACKLAQLGRWYADAHLAVEKAGGYGTATIEWLRQKYEYPNQHLAIDEDSVASQDASLTYGFAMNSTTRPVVLADLQEALRDRPEAFCDADLVGEMRTFVVLKSKPQADVGCHDDMVMAMAITQHVRNLQATRPLRIAGTQAKPKPRPKPLAKRAPRVAA
jgi:hypothetical protein